MDDLGLAILMFFVGASALTAVLSIGSRIALKPIIDSWIRLRQAGGNDQLQIRQTQRIELLEAEVQALQNDLNQLREADDFRRQLQQPASTTP